MTKTEINTALAALSKYEELIHRDIAELLKESANPNIAMEARLIINIDNARKALEKIVPNQEK